MLKPKKGICSQCDDGREVYLFKKYPPLCQYHYKKTKTIKKIKPIADKRLERLKEYRIKRDKYLKDNPKCEVKGCSNDTTNLHHKKGRIGELLSDERYFMACCSTCHPKRIHENPKWARENGYLL